MMENLFSTRRIPHTILSALTIAAFAIGLDTFVVIGALNVIVHDLAINPRQAGWIVSVYALSYALFAPVTAHYFRHFESRLILLTAMGFFVIGNIICAFSSDLTMMIIGRVVSALGAAMFTPNATILSASLVPPERKGLALSLIFGGMTVSQAAGIPITTWIAETFSWRYSFLFVVICGLIASAMLCVLFYRVPGNVNRSEAQNGTPSVINPPVAMLLVATLLIVVSEFTIYSFVSLILSETAWRGIPVLPTVLLLYGLGAVAGNLATGFLTDKLGPASVLLGSVAAQTFLLFCMVLFRKNAEVVLLVSFSWGIVSYMYLVPIQHRLLSHSRAGAGVIMALHSSLTYAGIAIGAFIGGMVLTRSSPDHLAAVAVVIGFVALFISYFAMTWPVSQRRMSS